LEAALPETAVRRSFMKQRSRWHKALDQATTLDALLEQALTLAQAIQPASMPSSEDRDYIAAAAAFTAATGTGSARVSSVGELSVAVAAALSGFGFDAAGYAPSSPTHGPPLLTTA
jgi:hypothetical protein